MTVTLSVMGHKYELESLLEESPT